MYALLEYAKEDLLIYHQGKAYDVTEFLPGRRPDVFKRAHQQVD